MTTYLKIIKRLNYGNLLQNLRYGNTKEVFGNLYSLRIMLLSTAKYEQSIHIIRKGGGSRKAWIQSLIWLENKGEHLAIFSQASHLVSYIRAGTAQTLLLPPKRNWSLRLPNEFTAQVGIKGNMLLTTFIKHI